MEIRSYQIEAQFDARALDRWIKAGWLRPLETEPTQLSEIDLARAQLIFDLTANLGVNDEGVPVILDLIDQVHGLRRAMRELLKRSPT
jgi:chaperone modulatory protein CbpM